MTIRVTLRRHHIPTNCKHENKVYLCEDIKVVFANHRVCLEKLVLWHKQQADTVCWLHEVTKIEPADFGEKIDYFA